MSAFYEEKLGFLYDILTFIPNLIETIITIVESQNETWFIDIPDIKVPEMTGVEEKVILEGFEWSPYTVINEREEIRYVYDLYLIIIDFFVYMGILRYAISTLFSILGDSGYDPIYEIERSEE